MGGWRTVRRVEETRYRQDVLARSNRLVPEEVPVAFSYGGSTHAVMMATPDDLEDFAIGFSLTEGIITAAEEIVEIEPVRAGAGIDLQITLREGNARALTARRRHMAGPVGCGLCGIESIEQATRTVPRVAGSRQPLAPAMIAEAMEALARGQVLNRQTHAVHGAGFFLRDRGLLALREDVGRHNALDKLIGAILRLPASAGIRPADGLLVVTSRLSVEMVQKAAAFGTPVLVAISAPTALAIDTAEAAGMTVIGIARGDEFEVFAGADRLCDRTIPSLKPTDGAMSHGP